MIAKHNSTWNEQAIYFQYLNEVARYPLLSKEEERLLLKKAAEGHQGAMNRLVRANLRFVINIANMYKNQGLSIGELINEGNMGLMEAARRFDPNQKIKFISYAVWWIRQNITRAISEKARLVRISAEKELVLRRLNRAGGKLKQVVGGTYILDAQSLEGVTRYKANQIEKILEMGNRTLSLDAPAGEEGDSSLMDALPSLDPTPEEDNHQQSYKASVKALLDELDQQEKEVINRYYGLDGEYDLNLQEIGRNMGLSKERVRQIKENALSHLRNIHQAQNLVTAA